MKLLWTLLFIACSVGVSGQETTSVNWEDLFGAYRTPSELKANYIRALGFDFLREFQIGQSDCETYQIKFATGLQGAWFEKISFCYGSDQIIYSTENSTFYLELLEVLKKEYRFSESYTTDKGVIVYTNGESRIDITSANSGNGGFTTHVIKVNKIVGDISRGTSDLKLLDAKNAKYYALIVGIDKYQGINNSLVYPSEDAQALHDILISDYGFEKASVVLLNDSSGVSDDEIITALEHFSNLREDANLLIFFAGHGFVKGTGSDREGYWQTSATPGEASIVNSISSSELVSSIKQLRAGHILVIADACFGGAILETRTVDDIPSIRINHQDKYARVSREAISSAGLKPTPDSSVFFQELLKVLKDRSVKTISAEELFIRIKKNSGQTSNTVYGRINGLDDDSGSFIFMRK